MQKNMNDIFYFIYLSFKNISPLRIFQIIESKKLILNGLCLELGASEKPDKNFSSFIKGKCKFNYSNLNIKNKSGSFKMDLTKKFKLKQNKYKYILIFNVLEHLNKHSFCLYEIKRVLKKNGSIFGSTPFIYQIHGAPKDYYRFSKDFYLSELKKIGYKKIVVKSLGYGPLIACFSLVYSYLKFLPIFSQIIIILCILLDTILQIFIKTKLKEIYPIGYFFSANK